MKIELRQMGSVLPILCVERASYGCHSPLPEPQKTAEFCDFQRGMKYFASFPSPVSNPSECEIVRIPGRVVSVTEPRQVGPSCVATRRW